MDSRTVSTGNQASPRATQLIAALNLTPHPEGGHYRRIYCSSAEVQPLDGRNQRPALTSIYFLLRQGEVSRWHRVGSDEVWHHYEGDPLELLIADPEFGSIERRKLGPLDADAEPVCVVPAGYWQAARPLGAFTLTGCTVAPGFDFADFELLADADRIPQDLRQEHSDLCRRGNRSELP